MSKDNKICVDSAALKLQMTSMTLIKRLDYADCKIIHGQFSRDIFEALLKQKEETINLIVVINDYFKTIKGKNISQNFRNKLTVYAAGYNFWVADYIKNPIFQSEAYDANSMTGIYVYKDDVKTIQDHLREMIILCGASYNEKFGFLINESSLKEYGETARLLHAFFGNSNEKDLCGIVEIANYFRYVLKKELTEYDDTEITIMFQNAESDLSGPGRKALVSFYAYIREHSTCQSDIAVHYNKHGLDSNEAVPPYDQNTYFSIAYMTMNKEYWDEHCIIQKAVEKEIHSKVWLYHLMHFMCAWRSTDIRSKLPRFKLQDDATAVLHKVANNSYPEQYYISVAEAISYRFHYDGNKKNKTPGKTQKYEDIKAVSRYRAKHSCVFPRSKNTTKPPTTRLKTPATPRRALFATWTPPKRQSAI